MTVLVLSSFVSVNSVNLTGFPRSRPFTDEAGEPRLMQLLRDGAWIGAWEPGPRLLFCWVGADLSSCVLFVMSSFMAWMEPLRCVNNTELLRTSVRSQKPGPRRWWWAGKPATVTLRIQFTHLTAIQAALKTRFTSSLP